MPVIDTERLYELDVVLRVNGNRVDTSHGAAVSLREAKALYAMLADKRQSEWTPSTEVRIGDFVLKKVTPEEVVIGCHRIKWTAIDSLAQREGWNN